jgi:hypothetical protein
MVTKSSVNVDMIIKCPPSFKVFTVVLVDVGLVDIGTRIK